MGTNDVATLPLFQSNWINFHNCICLSSPWIAASKALHFHVAQQQHHHHRHRRRRRHRNTSHHLCGNSQSNDEGSTASCYHFTFYGKAPPTNHTTCTYTYLHTPPCLLLSSLSDYYTNPPPPILVSCPLCWSKDKYSHGCPFHRLAAPIHGGGETDGAASPPLWNCCTLLNALRYQRIEPLHQTNSTVGRYTPWNAVTTAQAKCAYWHSKEYAYIKTLVSSIYTIW